MGDHGEGRVWSATTAVDSSNRGFLSLSTSLFPHLYYSTRYLIYLGGILLRHSVSTLFTTWASCTGISSQKISYFLVLGTRESLTWAPHLYMTPPALFAARATLGMQCSRRVMPLQSSSVVLSVTTVRGSHPVHAAHATASKPTGGHSAASCT